MMPLQETPPASVKSIQPSVKSRTTGKVSRATPLSVPPLDLPKRFERDMDYKNDGIKVAVHFARVPEKVESLSV